MRIPLHLTLAMPFALLACLSAAPVSGAESGMIEGTVVSRGVVLEGIRVEVYLEKRKTAAGTPFAVTESQENGTFSLDLPPGDYYLWAREPAPAFGPPRVTEYPGNPVTVISGHPAALEPIEMVEVGRALGEVPPGTGLKGLALIDGSPATDVSVTVYGREVSRLTGPGYVASAVTGEDGVFTVDLPPGTYRVAARKRRDGTLAGFLREGDYSVEFEGNPVTVRAGEYASLGNLTLHEVDPGRLAAEEKSRLEAASPTRIEGTVTGPEGKPLAGQYVFVYRDQGMIGRPDMVSVTGDDGSFSFDLPRGGSYYLGARSTMGGPRQPGEMAGRLENSADSSVLVVEGGQVTGLSIRMEMIW